MTRRKRLLLIAPLAILGMLLFVSLGGTLVMLLWNWLLPPILGLRAITFWQAIGLLALSRILFGGLGIRGSRSSGIRRRMRERWDGMSPEEREKFADAMRARWGCGPMAGEPKAR
jgi:hypothetical protein